MNTPDPTEWKKPPISTQQAQPTHVSIRTESPTMLYIIIGFLLVLILVVIIGLGVLFYKTITSNSHTDDKRIKELAKEAYREMIQEMKNLSVSNLEIKNTRPATNQTQPEVTV